MCFFVDEENVLAAQYEGSRPTDNKERGEVLVRM